MLTALGTFKNKILSELLEENPKPLWSNARERQGKTCTVES
jgi:hypothetical protein